MKMTALSSSKENEILKTLVLTALGSKHCTKQVNDPYITTLTLYWSEWNSSENYIGVWYHFKQFRPSSDKLIIPSKGIWMRMLEKCSGFDCVLNGRKKAWSSSPPLDSDGQPNLIILGSLLQGKMFCRPIGQYIIADVLQSVGIQGKSIEDAIDAIMDNISMDIEQPPWVVWFGTQRRSVL